ncbi:MAG TPA: cell division protein FtsL [Pyrinomonadaceae bacterium]|nr:cell division protein FtsL [Pyrinomonadaceae bacterium]
MRTRTVAARRTPRTRPEGNPVGFTMPLKYSLLAVLCASILVVGFFFAARQHFASIDYGIKNSKLRKQLDELQAEKRRLLLAKEVSLSPAQIQKAAQRLGLNFDDDGGAAPAVAVSDNAKAPTVSQGAPATHVKTIVINKPVKAVAPDNGPKVVKPESQAKRETVVKDRKG